MLTSLDPAPPSLALAAASDDGAARVKAMVEAHYDTCWRALRRLGVPARSLDDAAQAVFMVAVRKIHTIRVGEERPYLLGIALRVAADHRRSLHRHGDVVEDDPSLPDEAAGADELLDRKRARATLDRIIQEMPVDLREAFVLFELEGLTAPEVAAAMDIPVGTATSRLRRARELFREQAARWLTPTARRGTR